MEEELKEVWTTQILPVTRFSNNDYYRKKDKGQIKAYNNLSEYKPTYLPVGSIGYDGSNKTYRQLKTIKVRNSDGSFDYYMVPEFAVEGVYIDQPKTVVEPIVDLAPQNNQQAVIQSQPVSKPIPTKPNIVANQTPPKPVSTKSTPIVKQPVPQNLLPYIANVTSDGVVFFNIPDGYTRGQFEEAIDAVYKLNKDLSKKPMVYYEQPQQQIQQQQQQQQAVQQSQKQYQLQRQQVAQKLNMKYKVNNQARTAKTNNYEIDNPELITEVFAYPSRWVDVYNIHPDAYQKVLEYLNNNFKKTKTNNKPYGYILSLSGFKNVPIGGEANDTTYHYISKDGNDESVSRWTTDNANIINKNEPFSTNRIENNAVIDNGKVKMYSYLNADEVFYRNSDGALIVHPFNWITRNKVTNYYTDSYKEKISDLRKKGFTEQQAIDYINKINNIRSGTKNYNVDKSIFRPIEKQQTTQNKSTQQTSSSGNVVQKVKQTVKQTASKIRSFLGFQNGGQLKYYKNGK